MRLFHYILTHVEALAMQEKLAKDDRKNLCAVEGIKNIIHMRIINKYCDSVKI